MNAISCAKESPSPASVAAKAAAALLHFGIDLESSACSGKIIDTSDLEHYTLRANDPGKFPARALAEEHAYELESTGRRIWNTFLRKQNCSTDSNVFDANQSFHLRARLFGYLLLGIGLLARRDANAAQSTAYLVRLGLALSKSCINHCEFEATKIALQKVTELLPSSPSSTAAADGVGQANDHADYASYYILRIALSWKEDRLDLAEHMCTKAKQHAPYVDIGTLTTLIQVLTQIGNSFLAQSNLAAALPWFRHAAADACAGRSYQSNSSTSISAELLPHEQARLAALRGLLKCLTGLRSRESLEEASRMIASAQSVYGNRRIEVLDMMVMILQIAEGDDGAGDAVTDLLEVLLP